MQHRDRRIYGQTATPAQGDIAASRLLRLRDGRIVPIFMRLGIRSTISALVLTLQRIGPVWRGGYRCTRPSQRLFCERGHFDAPDTPL